MAAEPKLDGLDAMASLQATIRSTEEVIADLLGTLTKLEEGDPRAEHILQQLRVQNRQRDEAWEALKPLIRARIGYLRALTERMEG
jgi:hypothetical protein